MSVADDEATDADDEGMGTEGEISLFMALSPLAFALILFVLLLLIL